MDFQIRITEAALADFEEILAYSWANFPATAARFGNAILNHVELLKSFPYIPPTRANPILIYDRVNESPNFVEVLHFWHGSRHTPAF